MNYATSHLGPEKGARAALNGFRNGACDEQYLVDTLADLPWTFAPAAGASQLPIDAAWDIVEGRLSSRRDVLMRVRERVTARPSTDSAPSAAAQPRAGDEPDDTD